MLRVVIYVPTRVEQQRDYLALTKYLLMQGFLYKVYGYQKHREAYLIPCESASDKVDFMSLKDAVSAKGEDDYEAIINAISKYNDKITNGVHRVSKGEKE